MSDSNQGTSEKWANAGKATFFFSLAVSAAALIAPAYKTIQQVGNAAEKGGNTAETVTKKVEKYDGLATRFTNEAKDVAVTVMKHIAEEINSGRLTPEQAGFVFRRIAEDFVEGVVGNPEDVGALVREYSQRFATGALNGRATHNPQKIPSTYIDQGSGTLFVPSDVSNSTTRPSVQNGPIQFNPEFAP